MVSLLFFDSDFQRVSQSEGEEFSYKKNDLEKESSLQGAFHKCTADREPIEKLKLVKQVL